MSAKSFILGTAGHVDHGKSSLVKALTGIDPDRLPEEKARGITIDLGFAHLDLPATPGNPHGADGYSCGIIDVPGHEDFVKNMVAGIGSIDVALLVVAADDLWMPQSEEHLQILLHAGVTRAVIALTKVDLAIDEAAAVSEVRSQLIGTPLADAPIVPVSSTTRRGMDELRSALARILDVTPAPADIGKPRLSVDRAFALAGIGTVVTGTLTGGSLQRSQTVVVQPGGHASRIRGCQSNGRDAGHIPPGARAALNLPDVSVAAAGESGSHAIRRGDVVTLAELGTPSAVLDVVIEKSARLAGTNSPAARPLKSGTRVWFHLGTAGIPARVLLLRGSELLPGGHEPARLSLERPAFAFAGDRFILRDWSAQATLGGGIVLDPEGLRARARSPERLAGLDACAAPNAGPAPFIRAELHRRDIVRADSILLRSGFPACEVAASLAQLASNGDVILANGWAARGAWWRELLRIATATVDSRHAAHPEQAALPTADLRAALEHVHGKRSLAAFDELVSELCRSGFVTHGTGIRRTSHRPALPPALQGPGRRLREILARQPLDTPGRRELAPDAAHQQALRFLVQTGEAVELGPDVVLGADAFATAREQIRSFLQARGRGTASEIRIALGTSRRVLIPLLEKLDRDGVTRRDGDFRILVPPAHQA